LTKEQKRLAHRNRSRRRWYARKPEVQARMRQRVVDAQSVWVRVKNNPGITHHKLELSYPKQAIERALANNRIVKVVSIPNGKMKRFRYYTPEAVPAGAVVEPFVLRERKTYVRTTPLKKRIAVADDGSEFKLKGADVGDLYAAANEESNG
jgi:hypothetical protein